MVSRLGCFNLFSKVSQNPPHTDPVVALVPVTGAGWGRPSWLPLRETLGQESECGLEP